MSISKARSPAKLIVSGEHAVLYGKPALAMAVNRYAESTVSAQTAYALCFNMLNLSYMKSLTFQTLTALKRRLQDDYQAFLNGDCSIRDVIKKPFELLQFTVTLFFEHLNLPKMSGIQIKTHSEIPMGCGMGSSAATIMSTVCALAAHFKVNMEPAHCLNLGRQAENLQHGRSSGLDLHLALFGGVLRFQEGKTESRLTPDFPFYMVQTGSPITTTGECVSAAKQVFDSSTIGDDFESVTEAIDMALQQQNLIAMQEGLKANHRLLVQLGVVPKRVQNFIQAVEEIGGGAKTCGAGAVRGEKGGVVLVLVEATEEFSRLAKRYGYAVSRVEGDQHGTQVI